MTALPFFYTASIDEHSGSILLDEDNSRHVVSVLRMQEGELLHLTDGKGGLVTAMIADPHKKKCRVTITGITNTPPATGKTAIAISLVKNPVRFEWFLEKATEIGVSEIFPLLCQRTEKQNFRYDRMRNVLVSALLQSRQTWLPVLHEPIKYDQVVVVDGFPQKFIAHCLEEDKKSLNRDLIDHSQNQLILIGPEGDFTPVEIELALESGFTAVALGATRLRTETAAVVAAAILKNA